MDNLNQVIKKLEKKGFRLVKNGGSKAKLFPNNPKLPFYSIHLSGEKRCLFPLGRFSRKFWNIDLEKL